MITLYDFPSNERLGGQNWNPNVFKARYALLLLVAVLLLLIL
jgi:hypothetical protein